VKVARQWYDFQTGEAVESWCRLRLEIVKMFDRKVPFYKAMQKIKARKWIPSKESFDQYAIAKMALIHSLDLPVRDAIHLLIGGMPQSALRAVALSVADDSLDSFLERMRHIVEACPDTEKKSVITTSAQKSKDGACRNCERKGHTHKDCRGDLTCFYCKAKSHRQFDCPTLKNRSSGKPAAPSSAWSSRQPQSTAAAAVAEEVAVDNVVTVVSEEKGTKLKLYQPYVNVAELCKRKCKLSALVDTGSPVSFVNAEIYRIG
jgi:hypothetical protein